MVLLIGDVPTWFLMVAEWSLIVALIAVAVWAIDEIFFDLIRAAHDIGKRGVDRAVVTITAPDLPLTRDMRIAEENNGTCAILIPTWRNADTLSQTVNSLVEDFGDEQAVFIGCWPEDQPTFLEVMKLAAVHPSVHLCEATARQAGSTAACINDISRFVRCYEEDTGDEFDGYIIQSPDDELHPFAIPLTVRLLQRADVVRLPLLVANNQHESFLLGSLADSHAEFYVRELSLRAAMGSVPGSGLSLAVSRRVLNEFVETGLLDEASLAPDYDLCRRLNDVGLNRIAGKLVFLDKDGETNDENRSTLVIGSRRHYPEDLSALIRYRSRRILGTSMDDWFRSGWRDSCAGGWPYLYGLWRDRRHVLIGLPLALASVVGAISVSSAFALGATPSLSMVINDSVVWSVLLVTCLVGLGVRITSRHIACARFYGAMRLPMVLPRMLTELFVNTLAIGWAGLCYCRGSRKLSGSPPYHFDVDAAPAIGAVSSAREDNNAKRQPLGELLMDWNIISLTDRDRALSEQHRTGRQIGRILVDQGVVSERTVLEAVGRQVSIDTVEIDLFDVPARFGTWLRLRTMLKHRIYPFRMTDNQEVMLACYKLPSPDVVLLLREELGTPVRLCLARQTQVRQILRMFSKLSEMMDEKFIMASNESVGDLFERARTQSFARQTVSGGTSTRRLLSEQLVLEGYIDAETARRCTLRAVVNDQSLASYLVSQGFISEATLKQIVNRMQRVRRIRLVSVDGKVVGPKKDEGLESAEIEVV